MAAYEVHYSRLNYRTFRSKIHKIKSIIIVATYSYLLTNLVANFHLKFHQNQLKLSFHQHDLLKLERCGVVTWLVCFFRGKQLDQTTAYSHWYSSVSSANSSGNIPFPNISRVNKRTETLADKSSWRGVNASKFFLDIHFCWLYYRPPITTRTANL